MAPGQYTVKRNAGLSIAARGRPSSSHVRKRTSKKQRYTKELLTQIAMDKPLTQIAKDHSSLHIANIVAFVGRSAEERRMEAAYHEVPGQIKRPMNCFMLYRKAYLEVAKTQCPESNNQYVSKVCGISWSLESREIKEQFQTLALIEKANHQDAHPGYKYTPSNTRNRKQQDVGGSACSGIGRENWSSPQPPSRTSFLPCEAAPEVMGDPTTIYPVGHAIPVSPHAYEPYLFPTTDRGYHFSNHLQGMYQSLLVDSVNGVPSTADDLPWFS